MYQSTLEYHMFLSSPFGFSVVTVTFIKQPTCVFYEFFKKSMLPYFTLTCKFLIQNKVLKGVDEKLPENKKQKGVAGQGPSPTLIYLWVDMDLYFRPIFRPKTTLTQYLNRTTDPKSNHITQLDQIHSTQIGPNLIYN